MNESEFVTQFNQDIPIYKGWGELVLKTIEEKLRQCLANDQKVEMFLKVPSYPRVKALDSLINKAFYRGKNYQNPYEDITDKVGVRFVVLLEKDIQTICSIIESINIWSFTKDRNYLVERLDKPTVFDYQSVHYVVKAKEIVTNEDVEILKGTACEIQIRTLLQHAYSELTHDTIYKSITEAEPESQRIVAKSMALIETTDELFSRANKVIQAMSANEKDLICYFEDLYADKIGKQESVDEKINTYLLENLIPNIAEFDVEQMKTAVTDQDFLFVYDKIKERRDYSSIYRQPITILIYYLARNYHRRLKEVWPLTESELEPFLTDTGHAS